MEAIPRKFTPEVHAQLVAIQAKQAGRELDARLAASEISLRQWCVEQAIEAQMGADTMGLAKDILTFVTAPLKPEVPNG